MFSGPCKSQSLSKKPRAYAAEEAPVLSNNEVDDTEIHFGYMALANPGEGQMWHPSWQPQAMSYPGFLPYAQHYLQPYSTPSFGTLPNGLVYDSRQLEQTLLSDDSDTPRHPVAEQTSTEAHIEPRPSRPVLVTPMAGQLNDDEVAMVAMTAMSTTTCTGWSLDSGCTRHVTSDPEDFLPATLKTSPRITYQGINGAVDSTHEGDVRLAITDEQGLPFNINHRRRRDGLRRRQGPAGEGHGSAQQGDGYSGGDLPRPRL